MTVDEAILAKEQGTAVVFCHPWYTRGREVTYPRIADIVHKRDEYGRKLTTAVLYVNERCTQHVQPKFLRRAEDDKNGGLETGDTVSQKFRSCRNGDCQS